MTPVPPTNRFLDLVQNQQPLASAQFVSILTAIVLTYVDRTIHFTDDQSGLMTPLVVYVVATLVTQAWAYFQVWSAKSHAIVVAQAAATGNADPKQVIP